MSLRMESPVGPRVIFNGREMDYFSGTSYLGLQSRPEVLAAAGECLQTYGLATGTSRGGYGESPVYDRLEAEIRAFFDAEACLYFASGYLGNTILSQGLSGRYEVIFVDAWSHFSIWDGARASGMPVVTFEHRSVDDLAKKIRDTLTPGQRPLIMSDGLFPISAELAPAPAYLELAERYDGLVVLDDAHASGVLGPGGRGTLDYYGIDSPRCLASHTLSKALGGYGGVITASAEMIDLLNRRSRVYIAASPPPLVTAAAAAAALRLARTEPELRLRLRENIARLRAGFRSLGWELDDIPAPITCLRARPGIELGRLKDALFERGIATAHVTTYSSTPPGGALRVAVFATHSADQIDRLLAAVQDILAPGAKR